MIASRTYRLSTALVALLFALGWGVPSVQAACMSAGTMGAGHCGGTETEQHCDGEMGAASVVCLTHHASQEARIEQETSDDLLTTGGGGQSARLVPSNPDDLSSPSSSSGRALQHVQHFHAHVGVWLE